VPVILSPGRAISGAWLGPLVATLLMALLPLYACGPEEARQPVHEHLICLECGRVIEFQSWEVQQVTARITQKHGFRPTRHKLEIYGLCQPCQEAGVEIPDDGLTCPIETM